jgi:hypothetical protein
MTDILALDVATTTGWARGKVEWRCTGCGSTDTIERIRAAGGLSCCPERNMQVPPPKSGSFRFGNRDASEAAVFGHAVKWAADVLGAEPRPDALIIEAMLPAAAKLGNTNKDARDRLAGLQAIIKGVAHRRGIFHIAEYSVGQVRSHFLGEGLLKREKAKRATVQRCWALGWQVGDDNEADACALWSFAASLVEPKLALRLSPLFNRSLQVVS